MCWAEFDVDDCANMQTNCDGPWQASRKYQNDQALTCPIIAVNGLYSA